MENVIGSRGTILIREQGFDYRVKCSCGWYSRISFGSADEARDFRTDEHFELCLEKPLNLGLLRY